MSKNESNPLSIRDVERIWELPGTEIVDESDIERLVETPLVRAVTILFNKGIKTDWSTANAENPFAVISIKPENLSGDNLDIVKNAFGFDQGDHPNVSLNLLITPQTPVKEVEEYFVELVNQLADQKENN
jgi:hypothetical protein